MSGALLPRLRHLALSCRSNSCKVAVHLLSPSLRTLTLRAACRHDADPLGHNGERQKCAVVEHFQANRCPRLERLILDKDKTFGDDQHLIDTIVALQTTRSFHSTDSSLSLDAALSALAQLPLLEEIHIEPCWWTEYTKRWLKRPMSSKGFPSLRRLVGFRELVDAFVDHVADLRTLEDVEIYTKSLHFVNRLIPGYQRTIDKLGERCPNLRYFRLDLPDCRRQILDGDWFNRKVAKGWDPYSSIRPTLTERELDNYATNPFYNLERLSLHPFAQCPKMEALILNAPTDVFKLIDQDVALLAPAWPRLKRLQLWGIKNTVETLRRERTTASLVYFSTYCKELEELDFCVFVCGGNSGGLEPMPNLRKLNLRPVSDPETPLHKVEVCTWLRDVCNGLGWTGNPARVMRYWQPESLRSRGMYYSIEERDFR